MHDLNRAQLDVAKTFLGLPCEVEGNRVAILAETRLLTRTGTTAAVKVTMARARLACLPWQHPTAVAARGAALVGGEETWLDHSRWVMQQIFGVRAEIWEFMPELDEARTDATVWKKVLRQ